MVNAERGTQDAEQQGGVDRRTIALIRVALAIAIGDEGKARERMIAARAADVPDQWIDEILLQSFLNVGYPLALMAFGVWRAVAGPVKDAGEPVAHGLWEDWTRRGAETCGAVYGRTFHKLMQNLRGLHPALEALVLVDAYGKVIGRPGLDLGRRELCTLAAVATLTTPKQLHAHLRGALNTGSTKEDVDAVLALVEEDIDAARALKVWEVWADVRGRNL
jgi:4-carboxymuconolactone decarboxylase